MANYTITKNTDGSIASITANGVLLPYVKNATNVYFNPTYDNTGIRVEAGKFNRTFYPTDSITDSGNAVTLTSLASLNTYLNTLFPKANTTPGGGAGLTADQKTQLNQIQDALVNAGVVGFTPQYF